MNRKTDCEHCDGTGYSIPYHSVVKCERCGGTGKAKLYEKGKKMTPGEIRATGVPGRYRVQIGSQPPFSIDASNFDEVRRVMRFKTVMSIVFVTAPDGQEKAYREGIEVELDAAGHPR